MPGRSSGVSRWGLSADYSTAYEHWAQAGMLDTAKALAQSTEPPAPDASVRSALHSFKHFESMTSSSTSIKMPNRNGVRLEYAMLDSSSWRHSIRIRARRKLVKQSDNKSNLIEAGDLSLLLRQQRHLKFRNDGGSMPSSAYARIDVRNIIKTIS